ncbi:MAG TPA: hypothetical protein VF175_07755 [Lacipirellula sp.]
MIAQDNGVHEKAAQPAAPALSRVQQLLRVLDLTVDLLIARASMGDYWRAGFEDAEQYMAALPLPSADFAKARHHLHNAAVYCEQIEYGAAAFELRSLRGQLQRH